jgi:hypothetical protein
MEKFSFPGLLKVPSGQQASPPIDLGLKPCLKKIRIPILPDRGPGRGYLEPRDNGIGFCDFFELLNPVFPASFEPP